MSQWRSSLRNGEMLLLKSGSILTPTQCCTGTCRHTQWMCEVYLQLNIFQITYMKSKYRSEDNNLNILCVLPLHHKLSLCS